MKVAPKGEILQTKRFFSPYSSYQRWNASSRIFGIRLAKHYPNALPHAPQGEFGNSYGKLIAPKAPEIMPPPLREGMGKGRGRGRGKGKGEKVQEHRQHSHVIGTNWWYVSNGVGCY